MTELTLVRQLTSELVVARRQLQALCQCKPPTTSILRRSAKLREKIQHIRVELAQRTGRPFWGEEVPTLDSGIASPKFTTAKGGRPRTAHAPLTCTSRRSSRGLQKVITEYLDRTYERESVERISATLVAPVTTYRAWVDRPRTTAVNFEQARLFTIEEPLEPAAPAFPYFQMPHIPKLDLRPAAVVAQRCLIAQEHSLQAPPPCASSSSSSSCSSSSRGVVEQEEEVPTILEEDDDLDADPILDDDERWNVSCHC